MEHGGNKITLFRQILKPQSTAPRSSPYLDGQSPGTEIGEEQIRARLSIIQPYTRWIRSFSCLEGNQHSPRIAHEIGLKTMVGVDLGSTTGRPTRSSWPTASRSRGPDTPTSWPSATRSCCARDLTEDELIDYINRAKAAVPDVPVSFVDAYFLFENHPRVADGLRRPPGQLLPVLGELPGRVRAAVHEGNVPPCCRWRPKARR